MAQGTTLLVVEAIHCYNARHRMADWKQITARIRRARTSKDPAAQLSNLYEKTQDAMVAFELARHFETAGAPADAGKWYVSAAERFRRADWKTKALESAVRLGCEIPAGSLEAARAEEAVATSKPRSHAGRGSKDSDDSADKAKSDTEVASISLTIPEPGLPFEQNAELFESVVAMSSEVQAATDAGSTPAASATAAESKRRRRGRRGGRNRRKGPATSGAEPAVASSVPAAPRREPVRGSGRTSHATPRRTMESSEQVEEVSSGPGLAVRRPVPPLPVPPDQIPAFTSDPDDDPIVFGALLAGVDYLVSDDRKHVVPHGEPHEYEHEDHRLLAVTLGYLVSELMPAIDWDEIDGALLAEALAAPRTAG